MRTLISISIIILTACAWAADVEIPTFARPAVTVIPFEDKSPHTGPEVPPVPGMAFDPEAPMPWLSDGLPGMLELAFERSGALNVLPRTELAFALNKRRDAELSVDTPFAVLSDVAKREGATHAVGGSFVKEGKDLSFTVTVWEVGADTEAAPPGEAELERLNAEVDRLGEELALVFTDPAQTLEEKRTRAAEINTEIAEVSARIAGIATARVDAAALEELGRLAAELGAIMGNPELSWDEKQARAAEIEVAMEGVAARITRTAAPAGQSKEFSGKVEDVFSLVDDAAAFVLTATDAGGGTGLIKRQPTPDLEAFRWFAKGAGRYYTGEQISFFLSATQKDDNFAEAHLMLAKAYLKEKDYGNAKTHFEKSRALADYYPSAPTGLATITRKEEPENAEAATYLYNEALAIDPSYAPVFDGRGGMYFAAGDYEAAREAYEQFIAIWPTNKDGYYALGNTLWLLGKDSPQWKSLLRSAIDNYEKSLAIDPDFAACHYNLASVYKIFEDVDNAILHYRRYIELEPDSPKRADIEETIAAWEAERGPK
jgi:tetratricopeptide (TPR) repeat protein